MEIVISLAILSVALVSLLSATNNALKMNAYSTALTDAVFLAREEMENVFIKTLQGPGVSGKKRRNDYPGYEWKQEVKETPFTGVYEVEVLVFHEGESDKDRAAPVLTLKSYVMK